MSTVDTVVFAIRSVNEREDSPASAGLQPTMFSRGDSLLFQALAPQVDVLVDEARSFLELRVGHDLQFVDIERL